MGAPAKGLRPLGPSMGELTEVASAKRAMRGDLCEREPEEELELRGLVVTNAVFFSSNCGGVIFPDMVQVGSADSGTKKFGWQVVQARRSGVQRT